jgi:two-component system, chemotaxis family, chemotaxis protein CheY
VQFEAATSNYLQPFKIEREKMAKTILAVDDSTSIRQMVAFTLKSAGYAVIEAADGVEGLAKANANASAITLVLTDQNMPNMDGLTLIKTLRGLPQFTTTPILMLTTESSDAMKTQGKAAGATGWLVKPFDPHKLLEVVKKVIG